VYYLWATKGASAAAAGGDPASCDYYLESANGCQVHGMAPYFGGQQADPQGVIIKDDSTGFRGIGRNTVTATSIITEYIWGLALPEIWCNSGGNAQCAFMANALMVAYRDESTYADSLGSSAPGRWVGSPHHRSHRTPMASAMWWRPWWTALRGRDSRSTAI
jgi:hypothetical protein